MKLAANETAQYQDAGYLLLKSLFSPADVELIKGELPAVFGQESPSRVFEKDGRTVRSVYGSHRTNALFARLTCHHKLLEPAQQILGGDLYVYQFKINVKAARGGDVWEWHQDFTFWHEEDGMPEPYAVNAAVFLEDVTEENGPLMLIPGSQRGTIATDNAFSIQPLPQSEEQSWISSVNTNLKYALDSGVVAKMRRVLGVATPTGPAGSVLFFHPSIVHGSASNTSSFGRILMLVTYNRTTNVPQHPTHKRPDFLSNWDNIPLRMLAGDNLSENSNTASA